MDVLYVQANHFQTTQINLRFFTPLKKPDNTTFRLMLGMMNQKNQIYPSKKSWKAHLQTLYNMRIGASATRLKDLHVSDFKMTLIDPSLVDETPLFFFEAMDVMLNHPFFDEEGLNYEKQSLKDDFLTKKTSKSYRAAQHLTNHLFKDHPYLVRTLGDEEAIDLITLEMIKKAYQSLIQAPALLVVVGPLDKETVKTFIDTIKLHPNKPFKKPELIKKEVPKLTIEPVKNDMKQLLSYHVFETGIYPGDDAHLALDIFSHMLGGDSESILFKTIRENHSMAYSVNTIGLDDYGVLLIQGAIDPYKKAIYHEEIMAILKRIQAGDFEIDHLKLSIQSRMEEIKRNTDLKSALSSRALNHYLEGWPFNVNDLIKPFETVTKEAIVEVAKKCVFKGSFEFGATDVK